MAKGIRICDIPYSRHFYYKGVRYVQVIRTRECRAGGTVTVRALRDLCTWIDMPAGRVIKPVVRADG